MIGLMLNPSVARLGSDTGRARVRDAAESLPPDGTSRPLRQNGRRDIGLPGDEPGPRLGATRRGEP